MRPLIGSIPLLLSLTLTACDPAAFFLKPRAPFSEAALAPPPDYSQPAAWAAHPDAADAADLAPPGSPAAADASAAVFYIHPTAWFNLEVWNDTLSDPKALEVVDTIVLSGEASAFNACCAVYAPRYRQSTIGAFYGELADARASLTVAYEDVDRAFTAFLAATGDRPYILAGHSQGSQHGMRLLTRINNDTALRDRLVAAYLPGFAHPESNFKTAYPDIPPCTTPEQTGCLAAWDTYREGATVTGSDPMLHWVGAAVTRLDEPTRTCINPITWTADSTPSPTDAHKGAVAPVNTGNPVVMRKLMMSDKPLGVAISSMGAPRVGFVTARCEEGVLRVPDITRLDWPVTEVQPGNYHLMDYELFYQDIRENAVARVAAWRVLHPETEPAR